LRRSRTGYCSRSRRATAGCGACVEESATPMLLRALPSSPGRRRQSLTLAARAPRLYRAHGEGGALAWQEDNDFRACVGGACTALAWRPEPVDLQPLLVIGTDRGAEVPACAPC